MTCYNYIVPIGRYYSDCSILQIDLCYYDVTWACKPKVHRVFTVAIDYTLVDRAVKMDSYRLKIGKFIGCPIDALLSGP